MRKLPEPADIELFPADDTDLTTLRDRNRSDPRFEAAATDEEPVGEDVYFPPTDPVIEIDARGDAAILGGFAATSMDDLEVEPSALDDLPGDEALAEAVRRELHEDALTTDLPITVTVRDGIAYLHGIVAGIEDVEDAEEVAGRVPGIAGVVEKLRVREI